MLTATREWWALRLGSSLVCDSRSDYPDLIFIDNLDQNFQLFEKAAHLKRQGIGKTIVVPVHPHWQDSSKPDPVEREITEVMIRAAHLECAEILRIRGTEPITLNVALDLADFLKGTEVGTVLILTSGFRSKRLHAVFCSVLDKIGIQTYCLPVWGAHRPETWTRSWHGIQEVFLQHLKLAYYRAMVL